MRNISLKSLAVVGLAVATLSSCNSMKNLDKDYYSVNPNPLEVHGGKVKIDINGQYPEKLFKKNVAIELTPQLRYEAGQTEFKNVEFQGEEYPGNATVIPYETGKTVSYTDEIDYTPEMASSELYVAIKGKKGDKVKEFEAIKLAEGFITTSLLVEDDFKSSMVPPSYEQTTQHEQEGVINFKVQSAVIRNSEVKREEVQAIKKLVLNSGKHEKLTITGISLDGYASPEGEADNNTKLSDDRANNVEKVIVKVLKQAKIKYQDDFITKVGKGADWDGVYAAIKNSDIEDKEMILRSLDDQPLLDSKEATLQSLAATYSIIKDDILPELRRTHIVVSYELIGKTDEEIKELAAKSVEELKVEITKEDNTKAYQLDAEEVLYAASMQDTKEGRLEIMKKGMELYPADYRFATNAGHCSQVLGNNEEAISYFEQAYQVEENDVTINNLAVATALKGNIDAANELYAKSTTAEASYNLGIKAIKEGDYSKAIEDMQGKNTFNLALAKVLNGDYDGGLKTLDAGDVKTCKADYLRAIASARLGKYDDAKGFLKTAFEKNPKLEEKAKKDLEFKEIYATETAEAAK
jgi:tetratricopeptide (TPR) repeat protein/outer membrane protein OmpA-like peptidoglycan-associated protein